MLAGERRRFGYRRLHILLACEGVRLNHKRLFRLYREERSACVNGAAKTSIGNSIANGVAGGSEPALVVGFPGLMYQLPPRFGLYFGDDSRSKVADRFL